jgi:O-antigen/teichoic acid export membrane protein
VSLGKHSLANFTGAVVPMLVALVTIPFYLQHIGAERYGVLAVIMALLGYSGFLDLGLGRAVAQRMARMADAEDHERSSLLWTALVISFAMGLIGGGLIWLGADYVLNQKIQMSAQSRSEATSAVVWLLAFLPLLLPASALSGALQARLRFYEINAIQLISGVLGQVVPLLVAIAGYVELYYLVPATLAMRFLGISLLLWQSVKHAPLQGCPHVNPHHLKPMLSYGGWVSAMAVIGPLLVTIDRLVIGAISGAKAVAYYTVPYDVVSRSMIVNGSISSALFPRLASTSVEEGRFIAIHAMVVIVSIMTPLVMLGILISETFFSLWVGDEFYSKSKGIPETILIGVWVNAVVISHYSRFMATENPRTIVIVYLFEIPIYFGVLYLFVKNYGVLGAAYAWVIRGILDAGIILYISGELLNSLARLRVSIITIAFVYLVHLNIKSDLIKNILILFIFIWCVISVIKIFHARNDS